MTEGTGSVLLLIAVMNTVTMGSRLLGFFAVRKPSGSIARALHYLPYGLFAAIATTSVPAAKGIEWVPAITGMLVTAWTAWRRWPLILSLACGFSAATALRFLLSVDIP